MPRPRRISDAQILAAMRACVMQHGPRVPLDVVAGKLDVTAPALLKRFGSRQNLLLKALLPPQIPEWVQGLEEGPRGDAPLVEQLEVLFEKMSASIRKLLPRVSALRESGVPRDVLRQAKPMLPSWGIDALTAWLERGRGQGLLSGDALESAATAMVGAVQTRIFITHIYKRAWSGPSQRQYLKDLAILFAQALAPPAARRRGRPSRAKVRHAKKRRRPRV